jgi:hypothetical protein
VDVASGRNEMTRQSKRRGTVFAEERDSPTGEWRAGGENFRPRGWWIFFIGGWEVMRYIWRMEEPTRDHGPQPLDGLLDRWKITNHELVEASEEQLNHKQVQKARKGRQLTLHLMQKLTRALNNAVFLKIPKEEREKFVPYLHKQLFNYAKGHDAAWLDPNGELMPQ